MRIDYRTEVVKLGNGEVLVPRFSKEYALLETFLSSDIQSYEGSGKWFLSAIEKVLIGESEFEEITGNICSLEIRGDVTKVSDTLADDHEETICEVGTEQLKIIINCWLQDKKLFSKK